MATLKIPGSVLHGATVQIVRRDPFKRFVIVRLTKRVGDYGKDDELRMQPHQVSEP